MVSQVGGVLLVDTLRASEVDLMLPMALAPWHRRLAMHDPAKVITNLAVKLARAVTA